MAGQGGKNSGIIQTLVAIVREEGFAVLYRGIGGPLGVPEMKELLRAHGLLVTGTRRDLIRRIREEILGDPDERHGARGGAGMERGLPAAVGARARAAAARATTRARRHGASNNCTAQLSGTKNASRSAYRHGGRRALLVDGVGGRAMRGSEKPREELPATP